MTAAISTAPTASLGSCCGNRDFSSELALQTGTLWCSTISGSCTAAPASPPRSTRGTCAAATSRATVSTAKRHYCGAESAAESGYDHQRRAQLDLCSARLELVFWRGGERRR